MPIVQSFAPVAAKSARVLILGSMPGVRSLAANEYYAHPQNAFWPILGAILGFDAGASYALRTRAVRRRGVALWDVLRRCDRAGSLDSAIVAESVEVNDFGVFLAAHRRIRAVLCNGGTAFAKFERFVRPRLGSAGIAPTVVKLPSTSPANAGMSREDKLAAWRRALEPYALSSPP